MRSTAKARGFADEIAKAPEAGFVGITLGRFDVAGVMLFASIAGKLAGIHIAGKILKWGPGEASIIGWLLQTKALIMIIFVNILLDKQIITSEMMEGQQTWDDTAATVATLDLVITVDTAVAHLAGAMGKPVWLLLPFSPDWRWVVGRDDSPWYPRMRLFRQPETGQWTPVLAQIHQALGLLTRSQET